MAKQKVADYISDNICVFRKLVQIGKVSPSALSSYNIYLFYASIEGVPSVMERYTITSKAMRVSEGLVRKAVRDMTKNITA